MLGRLDAAGSLCRVLLPTLVGALKDAVGLWAAFVAPAAFCAAGLAAIQASHAQLIRSRREEAAKSD